MRHFTALALTLLAAAVHAADDAKTDLNGLQGKWEVTEFVQNGKPAPEKVTKAVTITFKGDKMRLVGPGGIGEREFTVKLDPEKDPKAIDLTALDGDFKGMTSPAIYELKGKQLKFCMSNRTTTERPKEFKSEEGSSLGLFVLKRGK